MLRNRPAYDARVTKAYSFVVLLGVTLALAACATSSSSRGGDSPSSEPGGRDSYGDPYVTSAEAEAVKVGMSARAAFGLLGGKAVSGTNGGQAPPPHSYDYPIEGTGNPDDVNDDKTIYLQVCVDGGRVVGKDRGRMDSLPTFGC